MSCVQVECVKTGGARSEEDENKIENGVRPYLLASRPYIIIIGPWLTEKNPPPPVIMTKPQAKAKQGQGQGFSPTLILFENKFNLLTK